MDRRETALHFARMGWEVFPCAEKDKIPATKNGHKDATCDTARIVSWWLRRDYNLGLPTGKNFVVLDADSEEAYASVRALGTREAATVKTGKGWQWYFHPPDFEFKNSVSKISKGIDTRGVGGYVVAPPSVHPNGKLYTWNEFPFRLLPFPEWLRVFMQPKKMEPRVQMAPVAFSGTATKYGMRALEKQCSKVFCAPEGTRNATLAACSFGIGQLVGSGQLEKNAATSELVLAAIGSGIPQHEAQRTAAKCLLSGMKHPFFPKSKAPRVE